MTSTPDRAVVYHGYRARTTASTCVVALETPAGDVLGMLRHVVRHSPAGLNWGYGGSGAADCARSLLIDALGHDNVACPTCRGAGRLVVKPGHEHEEEPPQEPFDAGRAGHDPAAAYHCYYCDGGFLPVPYQDFKWAHVAKFGAEWRMHRGAILDWLAQHDSSTF